jgi:hypothetical protein
MSIDEAECKEIMGEYKSVTVRRFLSGVQYALANANFLKSNDVMVLQALVLFLVRFLSPLCNGFGCSVTMLTVPS